MNIKIYTAITGGKDKPRSDIDCYTDFSKFKRDVYNARIYKILPHLFFDTDISMWIDGNIYIKGGVDRGEFAKELLGDNDIALFKHFCRDCIFDEAAACRRIYERPVRDKVNGEIDKQLEDYKDHPRHWGLGETGVLIRRHNDKVNRFNEAWWAHICRYSNRDQISFPVIAKNMPEVKIKYIKKNLRAHPYLVYTSHSRKRI